MKKCILHFVLMCSVVLWQGCSSKTKENNTNESAIAAADQASLETKKAEAAAKRERLEKARVERAEQRRLAALEVSKKSLTYKDPHGKLVYNKAEIDPSYTGGEQAMMKYLSENLKYPKEALDKGIEGTVFVDFVVSENGKIREVVSNDSVGEDVDQSFKDEAGRVVASMTAWVPGRQHGKAVDTRFSIPITFQISN